MDKFIVEGGYRLEGEVRPSGSKNACLPLLAATLVHPGEHLLHNVPELADIETMLLLLTYLGANVKREGDMALVDTRNINHVEATYDIVRKMRASVLVLGPLLARFGRARVSLPGGCAIGARPIDLHLRGLEAMGAKIVLEHGYVDATAPAGGLRGAHIILDIPSVSATEQLMIAATIANGTTTIDNAACEPEVEELARALVEMGAQIKGIGSNIIQIEGVESLKSMAHEVGPDRIETATFIAAAAVTMGDVNIRQVRADQLKFVIQLFEEAGAQINVSRPTNSTGYALADVRVKVAKRLNAVDVRTSPYPGFPTDVQAQWMACMAVAQGTSHIEETIFENRFMHTLELMRMGADISLHGNLAVVKGVNKLSGAPVMATDLRASASLILAGLAAEGVTDVLRIYHLDRGYAGLDTKLTALGAHVTRAKQEQTKVDDV